MLQLKKSQATASCPPGPDLEPAAGGNGKQMHRHENTRHTCVRATADPGPRIPKRLVPNRLGRCHIPNPITCKSRFESKSFLENILESNAGGGGAPPGATHCDDRRPEAEVTAAVCNAAWPNQAKQSCTFLVRSQPVSPLAGVNPRGIPPGMVE
jgi:hypothetical protein